MNKYLRVILEILCWLMIAGVLVMMFGFSSQEAEESGRLSIKVTEKIAGTVNRDFNTMPPSQKHTVIRYFHPFVRKMAHFSEYALLGALLLCAFLWRTWKLKWKIFASLNLSLLCAMLDELHQTFVSGRSGEIRDVLIDFSGALLGVLCVLVLRCIFMSVQRKRKRKPGAED